MKRVKTYWLILPLLLINIFITSVSSGWSEEASTLLEVETRSEMTYSINHYFGNIATQLYNNTNYVGYYTFQGTKGQLFRAMASSGELGHWYLGLTSPNGITYYTREGYNHKEPHQDALIERTLDETGTYMVRIYSREETYNGKDWPAAGHYTIKSNIELTPTEETAYQNNNPTLYYDIETLDTTSSKSRVGSGNPADSQNLPKGDSPSSVPFRKNTQGFCNFEFYIGHNNIPLFPLCYNTSIFTTIPAPSTCSSTVSPGAMSLKFAGLSDP